jgi:Spy/CpxP family protein refolding chaperone
MIGLAIGLGIAGLIGYKLHRRRHGCGWYGHHHGHHHHHHRGGWRGGRYYLLARLGATPAQEKVIREEMDRMRDRARVAREDAAAARGDLAEVLRAERFDRARFDAALGRVDAAWTELKKSAADSAARVHETLDQRQRDMLADFLAERRGGPSFGPFR